MLCVCCSSRRLSVQESLLCVLSFFHLVTDSVLSAGQFETQMAGALVQSSLEEVINRFIHFGPNPSSDSISIPAAINPNAFFLYCSPSKMHLVEVKHRHQNSQMNRYQDGICSIDCGWSFILICVLEEILGYNSMSSIIIVFQSVSRGFVLAHLKSLVYSFYTCCSLNIQALLFFW